MATAMRFDDVTHDYRGHPGALRSVSLDIDRGVTGLIGVNGAGKSTLLRLMAGALRPSRGRLTIEPDGVAPRRMPHAIGLMPQDLRLVSDVRLRDFLAYMAWLRGVPRGRRREVVERTAQMVGLGDRLPHRLGTLSGGMARRALFAQSVLARPAVLLLDEPTAGLDPEQRVVLRQLITTVDWPCAIVVSSHSMEDLAPIADRVVMLDLGSVAFAGTTHELAALAGHGDPDAGRPSQVSRLEAAFLRLRSPSGS